MNFLPERTLRDFYCLFQTIASLRSDKSSLDSALYEQQQVSANLETRKEQLEGENQELILKKEALQSQYLSSTYLSLSVIVITYTLTPS